PMGLGVGSGTTKATLAPAGMVRFRYTFGEGRLKPSVHAGIGAGFIRHVLNISDAESDTRPLVDKATADLYALQKMDPYPRPDSKPVLNEVCAGRHDNCWDNIAM